MENTDFLLDNTLNKRKRILPLVLLDTRRSL